MSNKLNSIRDKEAKESYETDKQRMSNIKEAGIIGKRFFLVLDGNSFSVEPHTWSRFGNRKS